MRLRCGRSAATRRCVTSCARRRRWRAYWCPRPVRGCAMRLCSRPSAACSARRRGQDTPRRPTIHGLRHSFAVKTLLGWYREGQDVQARMPALSTYLGHASPAATYWYYSDSRVIPIPAPFARDGPVTWDDVLSRLSPVGIIRCVSWAHEALFPGVLRSCGRAAVFVRSGGFTEERGQCHGVDGVRAG